MSTNSRDSEFELSLMRNNGEQSCELHYLDYAGAALYDQTQLREAVDTLSQQFMNPHSEVQGGMGCTAIDEARELVLRFLGAPPGEYVCIFTAGATASLQLIGLAFQWNENWDFCYTVPNHTEQAARSGARIRPVQVNWRNNECVMSPWGKEDQDAGQPRGVQDAHRFVLALPQECNLTGTRCSDEALDALCQGRITFERLNSFDGSRPLILLDAAKASQTHPPNLSYHPCHFVVLSFYKIFGFPTGLGALVVRRDVMHLMKPPFLGGGTVAHVLPASWPSSVAARSGPAAYEAGTPNFHGILSLRAGFAAWHNQVIANSGGVRACKLACQLAEQLERLRHYNGAPACTVIGRGGVYAEQAATTIGNGATAQQPHSGGSLSIGEYQILGNSTVQNTQSHGPVVAFVLWDQNSKPINSHAVQKHLTENNIIVRAGCCCNPGACAAMLGISDDDILSNVSSGWSCRGDVGVIEGRHTGVVRASLGAKTTTADVSALVTNVVHFINTLPVGSEPCNYTFSGCNNAHKATSSSVCAAYVYPVKSLAGTSVCHWPIVRGGLLLDRSWAIIDRSGKVKKISQFPCLQLVQTMVDLDHERLLLRWKGSESAAHTRVKSNHIAVNWPECISATLGFCDFHACTNPDQMVGEFVDVSGDEVAVWLTERLGFECFLAHKCLRKRGSVQLHCRHDSSFFDHLSHSCPANFRSMCAAQPQARDWHCKSSEVVAGDVCLSDSVRWIDDQCTTSDLFVAGYVSVGSPVVCYGMAATESGQMTHDPCAADKRCAGLKKAVPETLARMEPSGAFSCRAAILLASLGSVSLAAKLLQSVANPLGASGNLTEVNIPGDLCSCADCVLDSGGALFNQVVQRFRANIILRGEALDEKMWSQIRFNCPGAEMGPESHYKGGSNAAKVFSEKHPEGVCKQPFRLNVGEMAVRCSAIDVNPLDGTKDSSHKSLLSALSRLLGQCPVAWGVYASPVTD